MAKDTGKKPAKKKDPDAVNERYRITIPEVDEAADGGRRTSPT